MMAATSWLSLKTSAEYFFRTKWSPARATKVVIAETIKNETGGGN